jgi:hypothetical protein
VRVLAPTLLSSQTVATADGTDLAYLIWLPAEPLEVAGSLTPAPQRATVEISPQFL